MSRHIRRLPKTHPRSISTTLPNLRPSSPLHTSSSNAHPSPIHAGPMKPTPSTFTTINPAEISLFSSLSEHWWDPNGEFGLLHKMNPPRVEYIRQKVQVADEREGEVWTFEKRFEFEGKGGKKAKGGREGGWLEGKRCLDVGCGGGLLSESLARLGGDVIGVDASESNIKIANLHASQDPFLPHISPSTLTSSSSSSSSSTHTNSSPQLKKGSLEYRHTTAEALRDAGEQFDVVCAMEVVEHVDEPGEFMRCLGDMVKPGGHLILSTISRTPLSQLLTLTLAESILRLVTPGTHTYSKFIKPYELRQFVYTDMGGTDVWESDDLGLEGRGRGVGEVRGIVFDPVLGGWRLWGGVEGSLGKKLGEGCNYLFHARKRNA